MSQFLDPNNQQLVAARFSAQLATTGHFADQFAVADPSQFVTVVQHQQQQQHNTANQQLHTVANNFNFFQQHQNLSVVGPPATSSVPNMGPTNRQPAHMEQLTSHHIDQTAGNQHHLDHQQLTCVNAMNADNISNHIANGSPFIFDQTNGVFRIPHTSVLDASNAIVVNTITSSLRQQQHQLQQNQNHQLHGGAQPSIDGGQHPVGPHRAQVRGGRSDENGHKRPDAVQIGQMPVGVEGGGGGSSSSRSPNKSSIATKPGDATKPKCSKSKGASKKAPKPDKSLDPNRRTFACPTCGKGFTENFNMKRHMQIHSQTRPKFACNECSKSFAWKDNFVRHKKAAHDNLMESFPM